MPNTRTPEQVAQHLAKISDADKRRAASKLAADEKRQQQQRERQQRRAARSKISPCGGNKDCMEKVAGHLQASHRSIGFAMKHLAQATEAASRWPDIQQAIAALLDSLSTRVPNSPNTDKIG